MREPAFNSVSSRDLVRRDIERQTREFLMRGGSIDRLEHRQDQARPVGRAWRHGVVAGSFE